MESVCGGNSTAGSNPALSATPTAATEPGMELGPCASSSFEPCQTRKGAALRGNTASAAGCLGSMAGLLCNFGRWIRALWWVFPLDRHLDSRPLPLKTDRRPLFSVAGHRRRSSIPGAAAASWKLVRGNCKPECFKKKPSGTPRGLLLRPSPRRSVTTGRSVARLPDHLFVQATIHPATPVR